MTFDDMPHLSIEYTANCAPANKDNLLRELNQQLFACGIFQANDIKSRLRCLDDFLVGLDAHEQQGFVFAKLLMMPGRSQEVKQQLSREILEVLRRHFKISQTEQFAQANSSSGNNLQLCLEICDIDQLNYNKIIC